MTTTDCITLLLGISMFVVTGVLAWATWRYMVATKRMADSMETQTAIMAEGYERNIAPIFKPSFGSNATSKEETKIEFYLSNFGKEVLFVVKIITKIWNVENASEILQVDEESADYEVIPGVESGLIFQFKLNTEVSSYYPDREKKIKWETTFIVKDIKGREHYFLAGVRSLF